MHEFAGDGGVFRVDVFDGGAVFGEDAVFELGGELVQDAVEDGGVDAVEEGGEVGPGGEVVGVCVVGGGGEDEGGEEEGSMEEHCGRALCGLRYSNWRMRRTIEVQRVSILNIRSSQANDWQVLTRAEGMIESEDEKVW
jgi:hypothetical protein